MSEFNELNWKNALIAVYERAMIDPDYRNLCLTDGRSAITEVSDIELPDALKINFYGDPNDYVYAVLLPPVPDANAPVEDQRKQLLQWQALCTDVTTTFPTHP